MRSIADEVDATADLTARTEIIQGASRVVHLSAEERLAKHQREPSQVGLVGDAIWKIEPAALRIGDGAVAAPTDVDHRNTVSALDAEPLGDAVLGHGAPCRSLADVEHGRCRRSSVVRCEQAAWNTNLSIA